MRRHGLKACLRREWIDIFLATLIKDRRPVRISVYLNLALIKARGVK